MHLLPGILADSLSLYLEKAKALILSDLHIGYEEERRSRGILLPKEQLQQFKWELEGLFARHEISLVILNGDIKHEFGQISREEWYDVQELITHIRGLGAAVAAVAGNHDTMIKPILDKMGIELKSHLIVKNGEESVLVLHGDKSLQELEAELSLGKDSMKQIKTIIMGHEHPAMRITDGLRTETVKCFLVGKHPYKSEKYELIVMPSWNSLSFGTDIIQERPLGPLLKTFADFSAFANVEGKVLAFGYVESLQRLKS